MAAGDILQLTRTVLVDGQTCVNVMHFLQDASVPNPEQDLLDAWDPPAGTEPSPEDKYQLCQRGFTTYTQVSLAARRVLPTPGDPFSRGFNRAKSVATDTGLPTFNQVKVILATDLISRSGRGGFHIPALAEARTIGNTTDSTMNTLIAAFIQAVIDVHTASGVAFAGYTIGVLSRLLVELGFGVGAFNPATTISHSTTLGSMVSRRAGRGT